MSYADNILTVWNACTMEEWSAGRRWYGEAHAMATSLDSDYLRAAGVIAVFSPRQAWSRNVTLARMAYELSRQPAELARAAMLGVPGVKGTGLPTLSLQRRQAVALLVDGVHPDKVVKGIKTNSFMHTIADPSDPDAVVVDRHALAVAYGRPLLSSELGITDKRYRLVADAYREVANAVGEAPSVVQAATWVRWRAVSGHAMARAAARMDTAA